MATFLNIARYKTIIMKNVTTKNQLTASFKVFLKSILLIVIMVFGIIPQAIKNSIEK